MSDKQSFADAEGTVTSATVPPAKEVEHPAMTTLREIATACTGCSDELQAYLLEEAPLRYRLVVRGPNGLYEVSVRRVELTEAHSGPG